MNQRTDWGRGRVSDSSRSKHVLEITRSWLARGALQVWGWTLSGEVRMQSNTGNSTNCSSCNTVCCFQTWSDTMEGRKSKINKNKNICPLEIPPPPLLYWHICSLPVLERKVEDVVVLLWAADKDGCRLMALSNLSTLLSEDPTARGLAIVLNSFSLLKEQETFGW